MGSLVEIFLVVLIITIIYFTLYFLFRYIFYRLSLYKEAGGHSFSKIFIKRNIGDVGVFYTYLKLNFFRYRGAKVLANVYLPLENGTSEIDLIMIDKTGIYVIESKNFSGWIFGNYKDFKWCQRTRSYKNFFYNPIKQNEKHIECLNNKLDHKYDRYTYSYIVFSDRCTLKKIEYTGSVKVLKRKYLIDNIRTVIDNSENVLTIEDINNIYNLLKSNINVSYEIKQNHVDNIYSKYKSNYNDTNKYELRKVTIDMGSDVYDMYQHIPKQELGATNLLNGISYDEFKNTLKYFTKYENEIDPNINTSTTRYIFYVNDKPIGEILIRTTLNDFWMNKGSQLFYKIRADERNKKYGNKILELGLNECKKLGMKKVRLNCDDLNIPCINTIIKNGGKVDVKSFKTKNGYGSSYIIEL